MNNPINILPKDILMELCLYMDMKTFSNFIKCNKYIYNITYNNKTFWYRKLVREYQIYKNDILALRYYQELASEPRVIYKFIYGKSPDQLLIWASEKGSLNLVKHSLNMGADITCFDNYAINQASREGHLDVVRYLANEGTYIQFLNNGTLKWICINGHLHILEYFKDIGIDISVYHSEAMGWAKYKQNTKIVNYLKTFK